MKSNNILLFCILLSFPFLPIKSQSFSIEELFRNSYSVFELARYENGMYWDTQVITNNSSNFHPGSSAVVGKGLIANCIAHEMGWITTEQATEEILTTLKMITNNDDNEEFEFLTTPTGYPLHWFRIDSGMPQWKVEYSTIDAALLTSGALFAKNYFNENDSIAFYVDTFWESINWSEAIEDPETGSIYRLMNEETGEGQADTITLPFNEYMLVAWFAANHAEFHPDSAATQLWNNHYATPDSLTKSNYDGIHVLSDHSSNYLSSFVIQFAYYHCNYFTTSNEYLEYFVDASEADNLWWANQEQEDPFIWGLGAGHCFIEPNYCVDAINENDSLFYSPHIIAGFLPVNLSGISDLEAMIDAQNAVYLLPLEEHNQILWRKSLVDPNWVSDQVQLVDYSSMLFGLMEYLNPGFFECYNNYFNFQDCLIDAVNTEKIRTDISVFPNPTSDFINLHYENEFRGEVVTKLINTIGELNKSLSTFKNDEEHNQFISLEDLDNGVYFIQIYEGNNLVAVEKLIIQR